VQANARIANKGRRLFAGMVSALDDAMGAVVGALQAREMWDNTVLIVTTDNGGNLGGR
jgi:arylsulfatase A-like enzyme